MQELATERRAIKAALAGLNIDAWIFEDDAGARPQSIQQTYLRELEDADLYLAIFWQGYGDYTIGEFEHARSLKKDCLVYEKHAAIAERDSQLDTFLEKIGKVTTGLTSARFHTVEDLVGRVKDDVARWQTSLTRQALDQRLDDERERQAGIRAQEHAAPRQRVVNRAPQGIAELFKDRTSQSAAILDTLLAGDSSHRVVTVFGQGGIGKTALACRVMWELEHNEAVQGLVYLSPRTTGISLDSIYEGSARMLGGDVEQKLMKIFKEKDSKPASKIQALLDAYGNQRYVLLLDNLESVMDERGVLADPDLQQFLNAFLSQNHGARLLVTTREPLNPSSENRKYQRLVPLDEGLPVEFAIELLRDQDPLGVLGLRDAPESLLREVAEKTLGYPMALEAVGSFLSEGDEEQTERAEQQTLAALLADTAVFNENVIENLVRTALSRLDEGGHRVMQALAVFGRPVREVAVHYLLEPYMDAAGVQKTLRRLTRGLYVNITRSTGELILHPFQREFSYSQIPIDGNERYNRAALESRAATYYARLRAPREERKSIRDLEPQLFEFDHWLRAGQHDRAAEVLSGVDRDFLIWKGYARRVRNMHALLAGRIQNRQLRLRHHDSLGQVSMILGPHEEGVDQFTQMKEVATEVGDLTAVGTALLYLGETSRLLGRHDDAIAHLRDALTFFRTQDESAELIYCLFYLGLAYCHAGRAQEAIDCGEELRQRADRWHHVSGPGKAHNCTVTCKPCSETMESCRRTRTTGSRSVHRYR